jgi:type I site-specific restriction endonuclease
MMALADRDTVVRLIGNPNVREQEKLDIDDVLVSTDNRIFEVTRKDDWTEGEYGYDWAQDAANKMAAAELLNQWYDPTLKADKYYKQYTDDIEMLRRIGYGGTKDSGNPLFQVEVGSYKKTVDSIGPFVSKGFFGAEYIDNGGNTGEFTY